MKILISADGSKIRMRKDTWSMSCPAADLPKWIKLYTDLKERKNGAFARFYEADLADLINAQNRLEKRNAA